MKNIKKFVSIILTIITLSGIFVFPSYAGEVSGIESGASYLINFKNTNMGINVQFAPTSGIGKLCLDSTSNKEGNEIWKFTYVKKYDAYYITPKYRPGAAINALYGASASAGSQARLHDSNTGDTASLWKITKSGSYYRFKNIASGYYLDVDCGRTSAGTRVNLWHNSEGNQKFKLKKVSSAPVTTVVIGPSPSLTPTAPSIINTNTSIEDGASYLVNFKNTNMGINVQFAPTSGIGKLCLDSTTNKQGNEIWKFTYVKKFDAYYITPEYRPGAAINALYGASASAGSQARLHDSNINDTASLWKLEKSGSYYRLKNVASGYYLDVDNGRTAAGTRVNLWHNSVGNQQFSLVKVKDAAKFVWPVGGNGGFDRKNWPAYSGGGYHSGTDISASTGTPVYAAYGGTVVSAYTKTDSNGKIVSYGKHVIIECNVDGQTVYMYYAHLNSYCVKKGQTVYTGQPIGEVGSTGNSSGPHLHFEVRNSSKSYGNLQNPTLNPYNYLPKR